MNNICIENFNLNIGSKILITDSKLVVSNGFRYGLIGKNGSGKSSLLNFIKETFSDNSDIFLVSQQFESDDTLFNSIFKSDDKKYELVSKIKILQDKINDLKSDILSDDLNMYDNLYKQYTDLGVDKDNSTIKSLLKGLGFADTDFTRSVSEFSGGWKMRISLARALYIKPQLLLLDEPTNHLDLDATVWLTNYLQNFFNGTLIIVSHNKHFINSCCDYIIKIDQNKLSYFSGNYDKYLRTKKSLEKESVKKLAEYKRKLQNINKNVALCAEKRTRFKKELLDQYSIYFITKDKRSVFDFGSLSERFLSNCEYLVKLENVSIGYDTCIVSNINITLYPQSRVVLVGKNGVGKSTLLNSIYQKKCLDGNLSTNDNIRISYYTQNSHSILDYNKTPVEFLLGRKYVRTEETDYIDENFCRKCLGIIGLENSVHKQKIENLSFGQKAKVVFAALFVEKPHLIILDEPTNHLDIESIDALINGINIFNGAVITVTHNIDLIHRLERCSVYEIVDNCLNMTTFDKYQNKILSQED